MEPQMHERTRAIFERLQADPVLLSLLAPNRPFWNVESDSDPEPKYSIIPNTKIWDGIQTPFVTVQVVSDNLIGVNLNDAFVYIRCYNDPDKTYVEIDAVLSRVRSLLHGHIFAQYADNAVHIDTKYETTGPEAQDQAYTLNYRESRYRVLFI